MIDLRKTKDDASAAFAKGKFHKAAEGYAAYCKAEPKDLQIRLRLGDALAKAGDKAGAIAAYKISAEGFARDGFLPRAIAASKLILDLDPGHSDVQKLLADLYAKKGVPAPAGKPPPGPAAGFSAAAKGETPLPPPGLAEARAAEAARHASPPLNRTRAETVPEPEPVRGPPPALAPAPAPIETPAPPPPPAAHPEPISSQPEPVLAANEGIAEPGVAAAPEKPPAPPDEVQWTSAEPAVPASHEPAAEPVEAAPVPSVIVEAPPPAPAEVRVSAIPPPPPPSRPNVPIDLQIDMEAALADAAPELPDVPAAPTASSASVSAPPGLRPRKSVDAAAAAGLSPEHRDSPIPAALSWPTPSKTRGAMTDLEKGLEALLQFEVEPEAALASAQHAPTTAPPAVAREAEPAPVVPQPPEPVPEEPSSVLHSVEAVSAGQPPPPPAGELVEELMEADLVEEAKPGTGAMPKIPLFSDLPETAFIALFEKCPLHRFAAGDVIFAQGSVGDSFYVVCGGAVRIIRGDGVKRGALATLHEGAFFGEMALLSEAPRSASAVAADEDTQLLEISAETLKELSAEHPQVSKALKKFCRQRMLSNVMNHSALFRPFSTKERRTLVEKFRARETKAGDVVIKQGAMSDGLYIVLSGEVAVTMADKQVATLKEGEVFGEMSLLSRAKATATVAATKRTSLLRLPKEDFDTLIMSHPQILILVSDLVEDRKAKNEALKASPASGPDVMV